MWAEHLDIARDRTLIAEHNLPEGVARIGAAMHLLHNHKVWGLRVVCFIQLIDFCAFRIVS